MTVKNYTSVLERIETQIVQLQDTVVIDSRDELTTAESESLVLSNLFTLNKHTTNLDNIRKEILLKKVKDTKAKETLRKLDALVEELKFNCEFYLESMYAKEEAQAERLKAAEAKKRASEFTDHTDKSGSNTVGDDGSRGIEPEEESIDALRKKLLSTSKPSQLDSLKSLESDNKYHESIQEEYLSDITSFVQQLKDSAMQFQETIKQDAILLKQAGDEIEKSDGKLTNVGELLKLYHTKNKLSLWFYIRLLVGLFGIFFFLVILIRLIPARGYT